MKRILVTLFILAIASHYFNSVFAQNKDEKKKEKKVVIKIDKEENGKITKIDTTIVLKEGEDPDKILEQFGVKGDKDMKHVQGYKIRIDDGDTSKIRKEEKMVWVTVTDDDEDMKKCEKNAKVIIFSDGEEGNVMHMENGNVMVMRHPRGNAVYHIKEFDGKEAGDSAFFEKQIIIEDDMNMPHKKVYRYRNEPGKFNDNLVVLTEDFQGPPMFAPNMNDNSDSTIVIVKSYKDGKEITDTKRVIRNEKKEKHVMIKVLDAEKADLAKLKIKENYKKLDIKDFSINMNDNKMQVNFELSTKANTGIRIIAKDGKVAFSEDLKQFQGKYSKEIEALKGEFYIQVNQESKYFVRKVILDFN